MYDMWWTVPEEQIDPPEDNRLDWEECGQEICEGEAYAEYGREHTCLCSDCAQKHWGGRLVWAWA